MDLKKLLDCMSNGEKETLRQLLSNEDNGKTDVYFFIAHNHMNPGLKKALQVLREGFDKFKYIEDIEEDDFMKCRGVSIKSWNTFKSLRRKNKKEKKKLKQ